MDEIEIEDDWDEVVPYKGPYYSSGGKPILVDSYCLFMDILGYSQAVKKSVENGNAREEFGNFYKAIYRLKDSLSGKDNAVMLTKGGAII